MHFTRKILLLLISLFEIQVFCEEVIENILANFQRKSQQIIYFIDVSLHYPLASIKK